MSDLQTCDIEPFRYQATPQIDGATGASANQINEQSLEDWLNRFRVAVCDDLTNNSGGGGAESFLDLSDTPDSYSGQSGKVVSVKADETGLEFTTPTPPAESAGLAKNYSTSEQATDRTWIDGRTIYQKTVSIGNLGNVSTNAVNHNISNLLFVVEHYGWAYNPTGGQRIPVPHVAQPVYAGSIALVVNDTQILVTTTSNRLDFTTCYVTLFYTKSA